LVTTAWWNDIWLNEAFASWSQDRLFLTWKPEWEPEVSKVDSKSRAMGADSLISARKIRQPIESNDDIINSFDGITYSKGEAVLTMFEAWLGPEKFQKGIQGYLAAHSYGNATADDFLAAIT